jgi:hypothetical protein
LPETAQMVDAKRPNSHDSDSCLSCPCHLCSSPLRSCGL